MTLEFGDCVVNTLLSPCMLVCLVKEFLSLTNISVLCKSEGFSDLNVKYIGGVWIVMEFHRNKYVIILMYK